MKKILAMTALALAAGATQAAVVCTACEYIDNPASNLGLHDTTTE